MRSLRVRVLALVAGFGLVIALALAAIMFTSVRGYYTDTLYDKSSRFVERVLEMHPDLWETYQRDPSGFGARLREYILYSPNTGMYLLDNDGRILAASGENRIGWSGYRVDLAPVREGVLNDPDTPIIAGDPDADGKPCLVAARPVISGGSQVGWLYVVARSASLSSHQPELVRSYAIRTAIVASLATLAIGALLTIAMLAMLTRPLIALTRAVEQARDSGFPSDLCTVVPNCGRDDEVGRLSRTFRDTFERLRTEMERVTLTDSRRREMVASVSHDLRTPLTALLGQLETIRMKGDTLSREQQLMLFERAANNAQHLKRLTDSLAELARLDSPDFETHPEPIAIGELVDDVVQRFASSAADAGLELVLDYPDGLPLTRVDAALVERALSNLIDNALRVTPRGGKVDVRVVADAEGVRVEVSDTGPGVAEEDQARVFDRFYQTSGHREHRGSSGLGLAIVRRVAELHGGKVGLRSEPGRGATFFIAIPQAV